MTKNARNFDEAEMIARKFCGRKPRAHPIARAAQVFLRHGKKLRIEFQTNGGKFRQTKHLNV